MPRPRLLLLLLLIFILSVSIGGSALAQDRSELQAKMESLRGQIEAKEKVFLAPSAEDLAAFAPFLRQPDTGMARLMPREKYHKVLLIRGGGAYYSFTRLNNEYANGLDIGLEQERLSTGFAGANFGFLTSLGDVAIESVTTDSPGVPFLATLNTPATEPEAREQQRRSGAGFEADGFLYKRNLPAAVSKTYALRSIDYGNSAVLVVFRVTRLDSDGSLILAWRILKKFPTPQLAH